MEAEGAGFSPCFLEALGQELEQVDLSADSLVPGSQEDLAEISACFPAAKVHRLNKNTFLQRQQQRRRLQKANPSYSKREREEEAKVLAVEEEKVLQLREVLSSCLPEQEEKEEEEAENVRGLFECCRASAAREGLGCGSTAWLQQH